MHDLVLAVLPGMVERRAGGILISGSAAGNSPIPYNATYAATKLLSTPSASHCAGTAPHRCARHPAGTGPVRSELPDPAEASLVDKLVPKFLWISTEHTARVSLDALARNKMRVVPG
ncbi:putative oxidoreductase [Mycobacterium xenopi 4042]|uniref:Putative oxidoreductase n=1 Tax=Mycobacterium xenopi 4042 TaxID=1299334 RepID=X7YWC0_MYCXE|nr:putative oxidoreductase [Mycobacterium xenopi 4042]